MKLRETVSWLMGTLQRHAPLSPLRPASDFTPRLIPYSRRRRAAGNTLDFMVPMIPNGGS